VLTDLKPVSKYGG